MEADLKPVVEFLHSKGVKVGDVYKVGVLSGWRSVEAVSNMSF